MNFRFDLGVAVAQAVSNAIVEQKVAELREKERDVKDLRAMLAHLKIDLVDGM